MSSIQLWTYIIVGVTFTIYIGIAIISRARNTKGFYIAGHNVPALFNGMAIGADWMSAASFISMAGLISFMGWTGSIYLLGWTGGYVLLALLLAPYLRKYGKFTIPDFVGDRYYSNIARLVAIVCALFVSFTYIAGQMRGVGVVFSRFLGVDINIGVIIGMVIVFIYATLGGMKSITWTQVAQYIILIIAYLIPAIATFARVNMIQTLHNQSYSEVPVWFKNWEETKLLQFEDKNGDGTIQYFGKENPANELTVDRDIMVLANPEIANLPAWVVALVAAGGLAAALSTAAGLLLVISSSVSHDLCKRILFPDLSDKKELLVARLSATVAVVIAGWFGIHPPGFVAQVVAFAFGLAASTFFPILVLGIFSTRTTREGAITGMLVGLLFTGLYISYFRDVFHLGFTAGPDQWLFGISPEGIGAVGMILNFTVTIVVSSLTKKPPAEVQASVRAIRYPRGSEI